MEGSEAVEFKIPFWLRVSKRGSKVIGEASQDGAVWKKLGEADIPALSDRSLAGPIALSHTQDGLIKIGYSGLKILIDP